MENIGKRFGKRVLIAVAEKKKKGSKRYLCRCDCGHVDDVELSALKSGKSLCCLRCYRRTLKLPGSLFNGRFM